MDQQYAEIMEIPARAMDFWQHSPSFTLPVGVPYLGMGSSYFAALACKYMGVDIYPEMASEFFNYRSPAGKLPHGVILSQSGRSSEALWCTRLFESYTPVSNYPDSALCTASNAAPAVLLMAGEEQYSSSKTYINTLLTLLKGFGYEIKPAIDLLAERMPVYEDLGKQMAGQVYELLTAGAIHGISITGSGPNIATAMQAALILSESTKRNFYGLPMAQYDHGPKEAARNSIVIQVLAKGKSYQRSLNLSGKISAAHAYVLHVEEPGVEEHLSVLHNSIPFNFMAYYLAKQFNIATPFTIGGKVTEVT